MIDPSDPGQGSLPGGATGAYTDLIYTGDDPTTIKIVGGDPNLQLTVQAGQAATTVQFDIAQSAAVVTHNPDGSYTVNAGVDGTETLFGVTTLVFNDGSVHLTHAPSNAYDFNGEGRADLLIQNTNGAVVVVEVGLNDQLSFAQVGALGSEWSFVGAGDFLGNAKSDFLIENTSGALVIGELNGSGQATSTQIGQLGPEWSFRHWQRIFSAMVTPAF